MGFCGWLNYVLTLSMGITMICSMVSFCFGLVVRFGVAWLIQQHIDLDERGIKTSLFENANSETLIPLSDDIPHDLSLGMWTRSLANTLILMSTMMFATSAFGIGASHTRRTVYLVSLAVLLTLIIITQFTVVILVVDPESWFHQSAMRQMKQTLIADYEVGPTANSPMTLASNAMMLMDGCCGVFGPSDFLKMKMVYNHTVNEEVVSEHLKFAPACCQKEILKNGYRPILSCAKHGTSQVNPKGCYMLSYRRIGEDYGEVISGLFAFILLWEILQVLMAVSVIYRPKASEKEAIRAAMVATGMTKAEIQRTLHAKGTKAGVDKEKEKEKEKIVKTMVPYSKISSFDGPDIGRVRSTEIW